ncbi:MAG: site-specific DNA-methyltransferase [Actinobacteria bacterium]|nr:site-specific DNA-methyltransferase [Actinomycetota bacterium]
MNDKYKTVEIPLAAGLTAEERELIGELGRAFPSEDVVLECEDDRLLVHLRALDLAAFDETVRELVAMHGLQGRTALEHELTQSIERIGSYGIQGRKRNFVDYNRERKVKGRRKKEQARGPYFYARDVAFSKKDNPLPAEFTDRIVCGDSAVVLKDLPDSCVDLVFTSPPYNFGLDYGGSPDGIDWQGYFEKLFEVFDQCIRVLKYGGRIIVDIQPLYSDYIPSHHIISNYFMGRKLIWKGEICWEKNNYNCKYTAWGSWKSPSSPYLKYTWEFLEIFCKGDLKKKGSSENIDLSADEFKKWVVARWSVAPERRMEQFGHPAMFPEELAERAIKLFSYRGDVILDPFCGVGTAPAVAARLGRRYLGIDVSEEYCAKARERIAQPLSN